MKIQIHPIYAVILCFFIASCGPGDGSTLNPNGEPLGPPELQVNPSTIDMTLEIGKTATIPIIIKNNGGFTLEINNISSENDWISPQNVTVPFSIEAGDSIEIGVTLGESTLQASIFNGVLKIISNDNDIENSEFSLTIDLSIVETLAFDPTLTNIQSQIFNLYCTECHGGSSPSEGLNLTSGNSFGNLVSRSSNEIPDLFLVEPSNPDNSYLIRKLEGGPDIVEKRMPLNESPVSQDKIDVVRAWISQGAQDN